ncbi:hypothetical protein COL0001_14060 [Helicobacter pylori]
MQSYFIRAIENILKLENLEQGILFKNLCYEKEIKEWINKCLEEVANLHDLSVFSSNTTNY